MHVQKGEVFGFLGPNGAGKSTSMAMACGLMHPDEGEIRINGLGSPEKPEVRRVVGLAPQTVSLYDEMTAQENLEFFAKLYGMPRAERKRRVGELLEFVELAKRAHERIRGYSGGMKRRLNLAAAVLHDPELVLLDEPTAGVDPQSRSRLFDLVLELKSRGKTVVYCTHYMEEAQKLCDRVAVIDRGRMLAVDAVDTLITEFGGSSVVTVERGGSEERIDTDDPMQEIAARVKEEGVTGMRLDRPDLESVFLALTGRNLRD